MPTTRYYVFDSLKNAYESMTKQQIIAAIAEATGNTPTNIDDAFITMIQEQNAGRSLKFWKGTSAQYAAVSPKDADTFYIVSDDDSIEELQEAVQELSGSLETTAENVADLQETVYQINDTGWNLWTVDGSAFTYRGGYYRVKNGIAYFDIQGFVPTTPDEDIYITLPVKLDVSGNAGIVLCYNNNNSGDNYKMAHGDLTNSGDTTTLHVECKGTGDSIHSLWGSFSYPIYEE